MSHGTATCQHEHFLTRGGAGSADIDQHGLASNFKRVKVAGHPACDFEAKSAACPSGNHHGGPAVKTTNIADDFHVDWFNGTRLGDGVNGDVILTQCRTCGQNFALKSVAYNDAKIQREIALHLQFGPYAHPNLLFAAAIYRNVIFRPSFAGIAYIFVMPLANCRSDLFEQIMRATAFSEYDASWVSCQILSALTFLHEGGGGFPLSHRDLKPENFVCHLPSNVLSCEAGQMNFIVKICDFGFGSSDLLHTTPAIGTNFYRAPEVYAGGQYTNAVDIFSFGVSLYFMLCGQLPWELFTSQTGPAGARRTVVVPSRPHIMAGLYRPMTGDAWAHISAPAKQIIQQCLQVNPSDRPTARQLLQTPWICGLQVQV